MVNELGISAVQCLSTPLKEMSGILITHMRIVSCKCVSAFTLKHPTVDGDTLNGTIDDISEVAWNTSYSCGLNSSVDLMSEGEDQTAEIRIPFIEVQVFSFLTPGNFTTGNDHIHGEIKVCIKWHSHVIGINCEGGNSGGSNDDDDKIVPIAVGCALAGLVIIVLIAYLIGRFRNRKTDTYQVLS